MARGWVAVPYADGDEKGILELWRVVYPGRPYDQEDWMVWWRWMYLERPSGRGRILLAKDGGRVVGQGCMTPLAIKIGRERFTAAQTLDFMVHPDYRGQGMFIKLAKATCEQAEADGVHFFYGWANPASHRGMNEKLHWFDIPSMRLLVRPLRMRGRLKARSARDLVVAAGLAAGTVAGMVLAGVRRPPVVNGLAINRVSSFDRRVDSLLDMVSSRYQITPVKDYQVLNWRYTGLRNVPYTIYVAELAGHLVGYLVLRCMPQHDLKAGAIFECVGESEKVLRCLLATGINWCRQEQADMVYATILGDEPYMRVFRRNGFLSASFLKAAPVNAYVTLPDVTREFFQEPDNWFLQLGDADMV